MYYKTLLLLIFIPLFFISCNKKEPEQLNSSKVPVAKVGDKYLYEDDLIILYDSKVTGDDSILIRETFIQEWVKKQLVFLKALNNLTDEEKDKSDELDEYYQSLIKYEYEVKYVNQKLDDRITDDEIEAYYNANPNYFTLDKCLLRLVFLKIPHTAPDLKKVKKWYKSNEVKDRDLLHQYCLVNAEKFYLDDNQWTYFDDMYQEIPLGSYSCNSLYNNQSIEIQDSLSLYLVSVKEVKKAGDISPIEFERDRIKENILHKRRMELIEKNEESIFKEGHEKNLFIIYE